MASAYPVIRQKLVDIVEATTPDHNGFGVDGGFRHLESGFGDEDRAMPPPRSFFIEMLGGRAELPQHYHQLGRVRADVGLSIIYPDDVANVGGMDEICGSDAENLVAQLLLPDNWDTSTTGLELVGKRDGGHSALPFDIIADDGIRVLQFFFEVTYKRGAETNS